MRPFGNKPLGSGPAPCRQKPAWQVKLAPSALQSPSVAQRTSQNADAAVSGQAEAAGRSAKVTHSAVGNSGVQVSSVTQACVQTPHKHSKPEPQVDRHSSRKCDSLPALGSPLF